MTSSGLIQPQITPPEAVSWGRYAVLLSNSAFDIDGSVTCVCGLCLRLELGGGGAGAAAFAHPQAAFAVIPASGILSVCKRRRGSLMWGGCEVGLSGARRASARSGISKGGIAA